MSIQTQFMAVLNLTPDSFSDGGRFTEFGGKEDIVEVAKRLVEEGATILDVGGESTGPGSSDVSTAEELSRITKPLREIRKALPNVKISIDTWKSPVAEAALELGADIINDVTAGRADDRMGDVAVAFQAPMILMYSKDDGPRTSMEAKEYEDVMATIRDFLQGRIAWAKAKGVQELIIDPGMGAFVSTNPDYSFEIIDRIHELRDLGYPILVGASRKSFLGEDRHGGTLATTALLKGKVDILRVHDLLENMTVI